VEIKINLPDFFNLKLFKKQSSKRKRRGTAIVETSDGILVSEERGGMFFLPGSETVNHEPRREALTRELIASTGLQSQSIEYIFRYVGYEGLTEEHHKVYLVKPQGEIELDGDELQFYTPDCDLPLSKVTREIIDKYFDFKKSLIIPKNQSKGS